MVTAQAFDEPGSSAHARTANGTFTLKGLAPGRYAVTAAIGGAGPGDPNPPKREREMGSATVDLTATDGATLTIPLSKGVTVTGTVTFEGRMTPAQLRNLRVEPRQSGEQRPWMMDFPRVAAVKEDATFALDGLYRTPAYIVVRGLPDGWALKTVRYGDRDITDVPTDFASSPPAHLELVVTSRVASLTAKAVDDRGEQILASIVAVPANPRRWAFPFIVGQGDARAGAVKLGPMVPGDYFVAALPLEDMVVIARDPSRLAALATVGTKVTLEAGDTRLLTLRVTPLPDR
jgi:hypothetical protein